MAEALKDEVFIQPWHGSNVLKKYQIRKGDMAAGWAEADVIIEGTYHLPYQEHAFLQPEAGVSYIDEKGRVTVEVGGQWAHEDREQVAHSLGCQKKKCASFTQPLAAPLVARKICRCKLCWGWRLIVCTNEALTARSASSGHGKRAFWPPQAAPSNGAYKMGGNKRGEDYGRFCRSHMDSGAYAYTSTKVLGNFHLMVTGPYEIPNAHIDSYAITTNNVPGGAFRGFGGPQGAFAAETQMNKLAEALNSDPVEIRLKNVCVKAACSPCKPQPQPASAWQKSLRTVPRRAAGE